METQKVFKVKTIITTLDGTNCYVITNGTKECVIVDLGGTDEVLKFVEKNNLEVKAVLLTHGHYDHISSVNLMQQKLNVQVYAYKDEIALLENPLNNLSYTSDTPIILKNINYVDEDTKLNFIGLDWKVIHTPGHTIGGCCYYIESEKVLFAGDTLFYTTYGRYDLPTGDVKSLGLSINNKILTLPEDVKVYPGHGVYTNIKYEKEHNEIAKDFVKEWLKGL